MAEKTDKDMSPGGRTGKLVVIDGPDGCGKSVLMKAVREFAEQSGKRVFDIDEFAEKNGSLPDPGEVQDYDVFFSSEPTHCWLGAAIRQEVIAKNHSNYSARTTAGFYSMDRLVLYKRLLIPLLAKGKLVVQGRSVSTSIVYQPIQAEPLELEEVLAMEGNKLAMEHAPDLFLVADVKPESAMERLGSREKDDNAIFENLEFQRRAYERFMSPWLKELFEKHGSRVLYIDMNRSVEEEKKDIVSIMKEYVLE